MQKWAFLLMVFVFGAVYITCAGGWKVYAQLLEQVIQSRGAQQQEFAPPEEELQTEEETFTEADVAEALQPPAESVAPSEEPVQPEASGPVEVYAFAEEPVENDYFADAVFIGDSRTVGLFEYAGLEETAQFYASKGLTIYKLFSEEIVEVPGQKEKITIEEALMENQYKKIYLMIGINEMGTGTLESFIEAYAAAVEHLKELQPDAIIYLQAILKVTKERSDKGDYITNEGIEARNEEIAKLADGERVFYLDANPEICDEAGGLIKSYTFDGVHLKAQFIPLWLDYLKANAVVKVLLD